MSAEKYATNPDYRKGKKQASKTVYQKRKGEIRAASASKYLQKKGSKAKGQKSIINVALNFMKICTEGPDHICTVCHRLLFPNQVQKCSRSKYRTCKKPETAKRCITGKYLHTCIPDDCEDPCPVMSTPARQEWICFTCDRHLTNGNIPPQAYHNNLDPGNVPKELSDLNSLEQHLLACELPFAKIVSLPKGGQRGIHGPVVCVPSNVKKTTTALPRGIHDCHLIKVKLKRKLQYRGHYQFQLISPRKVEMALQYLKEHSPVYKDVPVNPGWLKGLADDNLTSHNSVDSTDEDSGDDSSLQHWPRDDSRAASNDSNHSAAEQDPRPERSDDNTADQQDADTSNECDELRGIQLDSCLQPVDIASNLSEFEDVIFNVAPAEGNKPLPILKEKMIEAKAFPALFPNVQNTLDSERPVKLTLRKYFNSRLLNADTRFAFGTNYIFFAQYMTELQQVLSSVSIALRKASPVLHDGRTLNAKLLTNKDEVKHLLKSDDGFRFLQPVRGTPPYWQKTMRDLFATIRQIGCPNFFFTFSCADLRWPEVIETIMRQQGKVVKTSEMSWSERCEALRSNPVTAVRMFDHRIKAFIRDVIYSPAQPLGKVTDHFYRVEMQARGSPHVHGLLWVHDAPRLDKDDDEEVCAFVDKYISCQLPGEDDEELRKIVMDVQMHRKGHSPTCKKGKKTCRFNFPRPPSQHTYICRPQDEVEDAENENRSSLLTENEAKKLLSQVFGQISSHPQPPSLQEILRSIPASSEEYETASRILTKRKTIVLKRSTNDCWVNNYNKDLLRMYNANMDIQYIDNPYQCIMYIVNYISKAETELGEFLKEASKEAREGNKTVAQEMRSVSQAYFESREVSAQEAVYRACSLPMKDFSREVVFIPTSENSTRMSLPLQQLKRKAKEDSDDENIWMTNIVDRYLARPDGRPFQNMCLATFASEYRVLYTCSKKCLDNGKVFALKKDLDFIQKRTRSKPAVIRYPRFSREKSAEKFYCTMLTLYLPHRTKDQLKPSGFESYEGFFSQGHICLDHDSEITAVRSIVEKNWSLFEKDVEAIDNALNEMQECGPREDAWERIAAETERERLEAEAERQETTFVDEDNEEIFLPELPDLQETISVPDAGDPVPSGYPPKETEGNQKKDVKKVLQSLNTKQRGVFNTIRQWCIEKTSGQNPKAFHIFLSGGAGTGKSHLIKAVQYEANRLLRQTSYNA